MPKQSNHRYSGDGAKGACYVDIEYLREGVAHLEVGWSCVVVYNQDIPVSWLAEVIEIASSHEGGVEGFLSEHGKGGSDNGDNDSYALWVDPPGSF